MKYKNTILKIVFSVVVSYIFFFYITSQFFYMFYHGNSSLGFPVFIMLYIGQTIILYNIINLILKEKISKINIKILWCIYFCVMIFMLYGRSAIGTAINLNIMNIFNFYYLNVMQNVMNFLLFLPIGYLLRNVTLSKSILFSFLIVLTIETLQLLTQRGIFDIVDIIIDNAAIIVGYLLARKISESIMKNNNNLDNNI